MRKAAGDKATPDRFIPREQAVCLTRERRYLAGCVDLIVSPPGNPEVLICCLWHMPAEYFPDDLPGDACRFRKGADHRGIPGDGRSGFCFKDGIYGNSLAAWYGFYQICVCHHGYSLGQCGRCRSSVSWLSATR